MPGIVYLEHENKCFILCASDGHPIVFLHSAAGLVWFKTNLHLFEYEGRAEAMLTLVRIGKVRGFDQDDPLMKPEVLIRRFRRSDGESLRRCVRLRLVHGESPPPVLTAGTLQHVLHRVSEALSS
jgi:hypothetical protein